MCIYRPVEMGLLLSGSSNDCYEAMVVNLRQDEALELWRETLSASVRDDGPDLSARQMAILLTVYTSPPPRTEALSVSRQSSSASSWRRFTTMASFRFRIEQADL